MATNIDPEKGKSIIYDNRSRISLRIKHLLTGIAPHQTPQSRLRRLGPFELAVRAPAAGSTSVRQQQHCV